MKGLKSDIFWLERIWHKLAGATSSTGAITTTRGDTAAIDAFGRQRMSTPFTIFDSKQIYDKMPVFWDESITNVSGNATSTHSTTHAETVLHVESGDTIIRQTFQSFNYQPGKSQLIILTGVLGGGVANTIARIGQFNANNGIFFERNGTTYNVVRRKATVDTTVAQADWNIDKMDGNGPSGITLDFTRTQIMFVDYEWLGVGRVRMGFVIAGEIHYVHEFLNANVGTKVYMTTPNLPVRYELSSTGGTAEMSHICSTVISEGGVEPSGTIRSGNTGVVTANQIAAGTGGTTYAVCGIRLKTTHPGATVKIVDLSMYIPSAGSGMWQLHYQPTLTNPGSVTWTGQTNSPVEFGVAAAAGTVTITAGANHGYIVRSGYVSSRQDIARIDTNSLLGLGTSIGGTPTMFILSFRPESNNQKVVAALIWNEVM